MNDIYHYPPDLFEMIVQVVPLLNKSKMSVITFFKGAGIPVELINDLERIVETDRESINKYKIAHTILERINENTDKYLSQRREIIKRIVEFEGFSSCWESDRLKAKGLVSEIQKIVNVKDSFTRMNIEREKERKKRSQEQQNKINKNLKNKENIEQIKKELFPLFTMKDKQKRGKLLEKVLNSYFANYEILIKEDFKVVNENGEGIFEQIDGIIEQDQEVFLVEMKWLEKSVSVNDIYTHLGRIYHRTNAHGIYISASGYSPSAINAAKEALQKNALLVLFDLEEFVMCIEKEKDFKAYLREKINHTIFEKNPYRKF